MPSFRLRLEDTYWSKGFFNVSVDFERYITMSEGPFDLYLGDSAAPLVGRVSRTANRNATPRIYGNKPLAEFFQAKYRPGDLVTAEILSPTAIRLRGRSAS